MAYFNKDILTPTVAAVFIVAWVANFGASAVITANQRNQFQSNLFNKRNKKSLHLTYTHYTVRFL